MRRGLRDFGKNVGMQSSAVAAGLGAGVAGGVENTTPLREGQVFARDGFMRRALDAYHNNVPEGARAALSYTPIGAVPDYFQALDTGQTGDAVLAAAQLIPGAGLGKLALKGARSAPVVSRAGRVRDRLAAGVDGYANFDLGRAVGELL